MYIRLLNAEYWILNQYIHFVDLNIALRLNAVNQKFSFHHTYQ